MTQDAVADVFYHDLNSPFVKQLLQIQTNEETYTSKWHKLWRFITLLTLRKPRGQFSNFENLILKEPNDCPIVSKYSKVERFPITKNSTNLSIKEIYLSTMRIPHPLRRFIDKVKEIDLIENSKNLKFENLDEKVKYLQNLPENLDKLPVVVIIHGLGGQISQFEELLLLLSQACDVFAVDLPGFGHSRFTPPVGNSMINYSKEDQQRLLDSISKMTWGDFKTDSIVEILENILINDPKLKNRKVVILGHSMGTHIAIKLNRKLNQTSAVKKVESVILLSPPPLSKDETVDVNKPLSSSLSSSSLLLRFFTFFPIFLDLMRVFDRLGGLYSKSITRMVADSASIYTKSKQIRWNLDSDSHAWLRYVSGFQRVKQSELITSFSVFKSSVETKRKVLLLCGDKDQATPAHQGFQQIINILQSVQIPLEAAQINECGHSLILEKPEVASGRILNFLSQHVNSLLDPSFVLILKAIINGDKWGLKNFTKWKSLQNVSEPLVNPSNSLISPLLAMKTLRNNDEAHSPNIIDKSRPDIIGIIDISADGTSDSYDPQIFERIKYYKLATISKIPPDTTMIRKFNGLVNKILEDYYEENGLQRDDDGGYHVFDASKGPFIAVHCHYGFNRTGYLICCYLIESLGWSVQDALLSFKIARDPGIKHHHFIDSLYLQFERQ